MQCGAGIHKKCWETRREQEETQLAKFLAAGAGREHRCKQTDTRPQPHWHTDHRRHFRLPENKPFVWCCKRKGDISLGHFSFHRLLCYFCWILRLKKKEEKYLSFCQRNSDKTQHHQRLSCRQEEKIHMKVSLSTKQKSGKQGKLY